MDVDRDSLGMRIHRIRKEKGLTLEEFGQLIDNASKSVVSKWERGITMPNNKRIKIIADISQISVFELLYGSATAYVYDNINSLLPDKLIVNRGVISVESIQYLGKRIEQEISSPTDEKGIKKLLENEFPKIEKTLFEYTEDFLSVIYSNTHLKAPTINYIIKRTPNASNDYESGLNYVFEKGRNLTLEERVEYLTEIETIYSEIISRVNNETHYFDTNAYLIKGKSLIKNIENLNFEKSNMPTHLINYKDSHRIEPLNRKHEELLISFMGFTNLKYLSESSQVLVRFFPDFKHEFLKKYYRNTHLLIIDNENIVFGFLTESLIFESFTDCDNLTMDLSKPKKNRYYFPVLAVFY